jgi:hypothetical protein
MIRWALRRAIDKVEQNLDTDASYVQDMIDASPRAVWLFLRAAALGKFRRDVPIEARFAAGLTAMRHEDCGPCTQLGVTMAERDGVSPAVLRAVLTDNPDAMPPDVALVWKFTRATLAHDAAADQYREAIVQQWGRRALVSLAFAIRAAVGGERCRVDNRLRQPGTDVLLAPCTRRPQHVKTSPRCRLHEKRARVGQVVAAPTVRRDRALRNVT